MELYIIADQMARARLRSLREFLPKIVLESTQ